MSARAATARHLWSRALSQARSGIPCEGKEKVETGNGHNRVRHKRDRGQTVISATGIRDSAKRTADNAGLNQGEGVLRSGKLRRNRYPGPMITPAQ